MTHLYIRVITTVAVRLRRGFLHNVAEICWTKIVYRYQKLFGYTLRTI